MHLYTHIPIIRLKFMVSTQLLSVNITIGHRFASLRPRPWRYGCFTCITVPYKVLQTILYSYGAQPYMVSAIFFFFFLFLYSLMLVATWLPQFLFSPMLVTFHLLNTANEHRPVSADFFFFFFFFQFLHSLMLVTTRLPQFSFSMYTIICITTVV